MQTKTTTKIDFDLAEREAGAAVVEWAAANGKKEMGGWRLPESAGGGGGTIVYSHDNNAGREAGSLYRFSSGESARPLGAYLILIRGLLNNKENRTSLARELTSGSASTTAAPRPKQRRPKKKEKPLDIGAPLDYELSKEAGRDLLAEHYELERVGAEVTHVFIYKSICDTKTLQVTGRFLLSDGRKDYRPLSWSNRFGWQKKAYRRGGLAPLYNMQWLSDTKEVLLVEGEKTADACMIAGLRLPCLAYTNFQTDVAPLAGLEVTIVPDADRAGWQMAKQIESLLENTAGKVTIKSMSRLTEIIGKPVKSGSDLADYPSETIKEFVSL